MDSHNELKEVDIENSTCYYFNDRIEFEDFELDKISIDKKSLENILVHDISYRTLIGAKPLRIRFDKIDGFITSCDGTRYLLYFGGEKYDFMYNRIRYFMRIKSGITYVNSHKYVKNKVNSYDSLALEKALTLFYVQVLNKSVFNKDKNNYYDNTFLGKSLNQLHKNNNYK